MTISNSRATEAYLHALNEMPTGSKPNLLARMADRMAHAAFDNTTLADNVKKPGSDDMMDIETGMFTALCKANGVEWRYILA